MQCAQRATAHSALHLLHAYAYAYDKKGGTRLKPTAYRNGIISMMEELD